MYDDSQFRVHVRYTGLAEVDAGFLCCRQVAATTTTAAAAAAAARDELLLKSRHLPHPRTNQESVTWNQCQYVH
jgi:hypothetical protein